MAANASAKATGILVEAEEFANYGGLVLDSQFEMQMGSPYLLAHGLGRCVADAKATVRVATSATESSLTVWQYTSTSSAK